MLWRYRLGEPCEISGCHLLHLGAYALGCVVHANHPSLGQQRDHPAAGLPLAG